VHKHIPDKQVAFRPVMHILKRVGRMKRGKKGGHNAANKQIPKKSI